MKSVAIIGGGLTGTLSGILLGQQGYTIAIYEKRPDPRGQSQSEGRSINLALSHRGWRSLAMAGLEETVLEETVPMKGRMIHPTETDAAPPYFQPYGKEGQAIYSINRNQLNALLVEKAAEFDNIKLCFETECRQVDPDEPAATIRFQEALRDHTIHPDILIGADGAPSAVRKALHEQKDFPSATEKQDYGYKEITFPVTDALYPNALHIWPAKSFMLIGLPNKEGSFTGTIFLPFEGTPSFEQLDNEAGIRAFFKEHFPDIAELLPHPGKDFFSRPTGSLATVNCFPWQYQGKVLLIGDAAHAIVPFYGQGMNAGFEDCRILLEMLERFEHNWEEALQAFQGKRKPDADAIAHLALQNFQEMRDWVTDPAFLQKKALDRKLAELYPDQWIPVYSMVTFSDMRYSEALKKGEDQDKLLEELQEYLPEKSENLPEKLPPELLSRVEDYIQQ